MTATPVNILISSFTFHRIFVGKWNFRDKTSNLYPVYRKFRYTFIVIQSVLSIWMAVSGVTGRKCRNIAIENFFNFIRCVVSILITMASTSDEAKQIYELIYSFENLRLMNESKECQKIYERIAKECNRFVLLMIFMCNFGAIPYYILGVR